MNQTLGSFEVGCVYVPVGGGILKVGSDMGLTDAGGREAEFQFKSRPQSLAVYRF